MTNMHWADGWGWGWSGWIAMSLMMIVVWGLLIAAIVYVVRASGRGHDERPAPEDDYTPERILEQRYARGEIDDEEFKRRREMLRSRS